MGKPDTQQRGLAGEYYVAFILTRLGYDIGITIGRAKVFDIVALGNSGKAVNIQVKSTYEGYDWLVKKDSIDSNINTVVALVRLGKYPDREPELYLVPGVKASAMITHKYVNHSPRISRKEVCEKFEDHDFAFIEKLLSK